MDKGCLSFIIIWIILGFIAGALTENFLAGYIIGFIATVILGFYITRND